MIEALRHQLRNLGNKASNALFEVRVANQTGFLSALTPTGLLAFARTVVGLRVGHHLALILHAQNKPEKTAIVDGSRKYSYAEVDGEINRLGHALVAMNIGAGDHVALMLPNSAEYLIAQQTIARVGATAVQIGTRLKAAELAHILANSSPLALFYHHDYRAELEEALALGAGAARGQLVVCGAPAGSMTGASRYEDLIAGMPGAHPPATSSRGGGVIVYTSGTTGKPKGANRDMTETGLVGIADFMARVGMTHHERHLVVCPLYHSAAPAFTSMVFGLGATVVMVDHFEPERVLEVIARESITSAFMVPTMLSRLADLDEEVRRSYDTSALRWILSGAAPLPTDTARRFQEAFGYLLWNFYGATETGMVTLAAPHDHAARPGTVGRLLRGNQVRLLDGEGRQVRAGEIGELYTSNEMLITGYHRDPTSTDSSLADGFFSVGDLGRMDDDGYYYIESRKSDMVISGGVNIYPREIEDHLLTHADVVDVAVVGVPDAEWGETLKAFVVRRPGALLTSATVIEFCRQGLADYKRPRAVAFIDVLPRTPTGKVLKRELRQR